MSGDKLTVTQEDVARAKEVAALTYGTAPLQDVAELFARHRTNTTTELVEALQEIVALDQPIDIVDVMNPLAREAVEIAREALTLHDRALAK